MDTITIFYEAYEYDGSNWCHIIRINETQCPIHEAYNVYKYHTFTLRAQKYLLLDLLSSLLENVTGNLESECFLTK